jgi:transcriptional regulator of acetoin/glycerol metabolism
MADDQMIRLDDLPQEVAECRPSQPASPEAVVVGDDLAAIEKAHVIEILAREGGNKARAARALGVNRRSLYRLLEKYNIRLGENGHGGAPQETPAGEPTAT